MAEVKTLGPTLMVPGTRSVVIWRKTPNVGADVMTAVAVTPSGSIIDVTTDLTAVATGAVPCYRLRVRPDSEGDWYYEISDATSGDWGACMATAKEFPDLIDKPISDIAKQRVDIGRLRTDVRNRSGR